MVFQRGMYLGGSLVPPNPTKSIIGRNGLLLDFQMSECNSRKSKGSVACVEV